jgi:hypothetical protein
MEANLGRDETLITTKNLGIEAFNADKKIEAMKRLMLHRIDSSLLLPSFDVSTGYRLYFDK